MTRLISALAAVIIAISSEGTDALQQYNLATITTQIRSVDNMQFPLENINTERCERLTASLGRVSGPSGEETYYNLDVSYIVERMHSWGYTGDYWIREDGVKMFGEYVMVAANIEIRPFGTLVETTLGTGIVCDTGEFAQYDPYALDIATTW